MYKPTHYDEHIFLLGYYLHFVIYIFEPAECLSASYSNNVSGSDSLGPYELTTASVKDLYNAIL